MINWSFGGPGFAAIALALSDRNEAVVLPEPMSKLKGVIVFGQKVDLKRWNG